MSFQDTSAVRREPLVPKTRVLGTDALPSQTAQVITGEHQAAGKESYRKTPSPRQQPSNPIVGAGESCVQEGPYQQHWNHQVLRESQFHNEAAEAVTLTVYAINGQG